MLLSKIRTDIYDYIFLNIKYKYINPKATLLYPIDLEFTLEDEEEYYTPKDNQGIPMKKYSSIGVQYNPTRVAAYGLAHWNKYKKHNDKESKVEFTKSLEWFVENHNNGLWEYKFRWGDLEANWISCMAQGEAISMLVRGYFLTNNIDYIKLAFNALEPLNQEISQGGLLSKVNGEVFFEEYPSQRPTHVLNGFLYLLIGLIDLDTVDYGNNFSKEKSSLKKTINQAVRSLEKNIDNWDLGYWSAYDLHRKNQGQRNACTIVYHSIHIAQLKHIYEYSHSEEIKEVYKRWENYMNNPIYRVKALINKVIYRLQHPAQR